eukprot:1889402-Prymnesium_polylepis.1
MRRIERGVDDGGVGAVVVSDVLRVDLRANVGPLDARDLRPAALRRARCRAGATAAVACGARSRHVREALRLSPCARRRRRRRAGG